MRADGRRWGPGDEDRRAKAGLDLGIHFGLVEYRADWSQVVFGWGCRNWESNRMCFKCQATSGNC
eukprot:2004182-Alexandrium_andersonii.AAC.1